MLERTSLQMVRTDIVLIFQLLSSSLLSANEQNLAWNAG